MAAPADVPSDDQWHVRVGNEEKVVTLEQLDDLFRLEIIDSQTKVWQPGMPEWLPLSVVAGMDDSAEAEPPAPPPAPPAPLPKFSGNKTQVGLGPKAGVPAATPAELPRPPVVVPSVTKQTLPFGASNDASSSPLAPVPSVLSQPPPPPSSRQPPPPSSRQPPRPGGPVSSRPPPRPGGPSSRPPPPSTASSAKSAQASAPAPSAAPPPPPPPAAMAEIPAAPPSLPPAPPPPPPPPLPSAPPPQAIDPNALLRAYAPAAPAPSPVAAVEHLAVEKPATRNAPGLPLVARGFLILLGLCAALLTLQRNDLLGASARSVLGGPSPETPAGVRAFLASLPPLASPDSLKPKPLPPRAVEPRPDQEPRAVQPARPAPAGKASSVKAKKPAKGGKAKPPKGK